MAVHCHQDTSVCQSVRVTDGQALQPRPGCRAVGTLLVFMSPCLCPGRSPPCSVPSHPCQPKAFGDSAQRPLFPSPWVRQNCHDICRVLCLSKCPQHEPPSALAEFLVSVIWGRLVIAFLVAWCPPCGLRARVWRERAGGGTVGLNEGARDLPGRGRRHNTCP